MKKIFIAILALAVIAPAMAMRPRPAKQGRPSNEITVSGTASKNNAKKNLLDRQSMLTDQIAALSGELSGSKKSVAKKISKQLEALNADLAVVTRLIATFPTERNNSASIEAEDALFKLQLDSVAAVRIAITDPYAGKISTDPALEKMYREYLAQNGTVPFIEFNSQGELDIQSDPAVYSSGAKIYRVMIAISKNAMPLSEFSGLTDVLEQRLPSGGRVYYQGSYNTKSEADQACRAVLAQRRFRDAFVVAMVGGKRVPIN